MDPPNSDTGQKKCKTMSTPCSQSGSTAHHRKIRVRKIGTLRCLEENVRCQPMPFFHVFICRQCTPCWQTTRRFRDAPCLTAIKTSCLHPHKRFIPVAAMEPRIRLMIPNRKADNDLVVPCPNTVIRWPASVAARLAIDCNLSHPCLYSPIF